MTAPLSHFKVSGVWKQCKKIHIKADGVWKEVKKAYVKQSGVWKQIHQYARFLYEGFTVTGTVSRGSTHTDYENLAYVGIVYSNDSNSRTYGAITWDGAAGDHGLGAVDNGDSEHRGVAIGMINVGPLDGDLDYDKTFSAGGTMLDSLRNWVRLVGGTGPVTFVTGAGFGSGPSYPQDLSYSGLENDVVFVAWASRVSSGSSNFAATNMTELYRDSTRGLYIKQLTANGTFTTTLTNTNKTQQWVHAWAVYRPTM